MDMYVRLGMYLGSLTWAHLVVKLCPKNLCVTNVAFLGLPSLPCVFWNSIEIFLEVLMAMVAQTSQVSARALRSLLISPCCATTWHVDPWHICVVLNSCVPRIFVPQMLPLSVCLCLPCFFWSMALWNLFGCLDCAGCTDFPSQQKSFVKLADISMLCDNMTRWPLTHLCCLKQLCPKNLRATKMFFYVRCWNLFENLSVGNVFQRGIHSCTRCPNATELGWACWNFHAVPEYVTHLALDTSVCF